MRFKWITLWCCIMAVALAAPAASAQDDSEVIPVDHVKTIRLCQPGIPSDVDVPAFMSSGEIKLLGGLTYIPPKVTPGPAPAPYPAAFVWDKGIEQLGAASATVEGIWFINGNLWSPHKLALVQWKVVIPNAKDRFATEFEQDLTLALWIDWNQDKAWTANEKMINLSFNVHDLFPNNYSSVEVYYLTSFWIPRATIFVTETAGGVTKLTAKLWARGALSYDDPDVGVAGQSLFGEYEDYLINYFEIVADPKTKG